MKSLLLLTMILFAGLSALANDCSPAIRRALLQADTRFQQGNRSCVARATSQLQQTPTLNLIGTAAVTCRLTLSNGHQVDIPRTYEFLVNPGTCNTVVLNQLSTQALSETNRAGVAGGGYIYYGSCSPSGTCQNGTAHYINGGCECIWAPKNQK